jgi:predicted nuclease of predicted toxin-antitoxin system
MNLLADESVDAAIVARLRADGHAVEYVAEMMPSVSDEVVLARANAIGAILVTGDKDFGEMLFRLHRTSGGVILVRLAGLLPASKARIVAEALSAHRSEMAEAFTVVSAGTVRIRRRT